MTELLITPTERARKAHARILQALQEPGTGIAIADKLNVSESTVSRIKNEKLEEVLAFIYASGFKIVPQNSVCVNVQALEFMRLLAAKILADKELAGQLFHEDE